VDDFAPGAADCTFVGLRPKVISTQNDDAIVAHGNEFEAIGDGKVAIIDGKERGGKKYRPLSAGGRFKL
jgi:hypothetical protein